MAKSVIGASVLSVMLLAMWSYFAVDAFLQWEKRADVAGPPVERAYFDTANDFIDYLAGSHSLQVAGNGDSKSLSDSRLALAGLAALLPTLFFMMIRGSGNILSVTLAAGVSLFCGLAHLIVLAGQLAGRALAVAETGSMVYDFSVYSFALYCTLVGALAVVCGLCAGGLMRGESRAWKRCMWSSLALIALNAPLLPVWNVPEFAISGLAGVFLPVCFATLNLLVLGMTGANFSFDRDG